MYYSNYKKTILAHVNEHYTYAELTAAFPYRTVKSNPLIELQDALAYYICYI
jgi:hypothetical protein